MTAAIVQIVRTSITEEMERELIDAGLRNPEYNTRTPKAAWPVWDELSAVEQDALEYTHTHLTMGQTSGLFLTIRQYLAGGREEPSANWWVGTGGDWGDQVFHEAEQFEGNPELNAMASAIADGIKAKIQAKVDAWNDRAREAGDAKWVFWQTPEGKKARRLLLNEAALNRSLLGFHEEAKALRNRQAEIV